MADLIGRQIGNYLIEDKIGEGGMAIVFKGQDLNLHRPVAIKVLHTHFANQDQFRERFLLEARTLARLGNHPSIISVYDFGNLDGDYYTVMEFVPGSNLQTHIWHLRGSGQLFLLNEILLTIAQIADGLGFAHRNSVVHRNVKPSNVMFRLLEEPDREGDLAMRAIITDFGLAKLLEDGLATEPGVIVGTLAYMSPEQCQGEEVDGRSDLYSLGIMLYQLATGQLPFPVRTPSEAIQMHVHEKPPPPQEIRPGLASEVTKIIEQAIAKEPNERFQTGETMANALRSAELSLTQADIAKRAPDSETSSLFRLVAANYDADVPLAPAAPVSQGALKVAPTHRSQQSSRLQPPSQSKETVAPGRIFISYRREDAAGFAGRLYDRLAANFGEERLFMDIDAILPGEDFVDVINRELDSCAVLVAVIGPNWLSAADAAGRPRLDNPDDFVRLEIGKALERNIRVIPVLWQRAVMPRSSELPKDLTSLARRNAVEVEHASFQRDVAPLMTALEQLLAE